MGSLEIIAGRLHLLLLHLPIGIWVLAVFMEVYRFRSGAAIQPAIRFALGIGALFSVPTTVSGWLLSQEGVYDPASVQTHQWLGISAAAFALFSWWQYGKRLSFPVMALTMVLFTAAGHAGGTLTHGEDFLLPDPAEEIQEPLQLAALSDTARTVYEGWVVPVLNNKCMRCHKTGKAKGELAMDSPELLFKGGKHGNPVLAGNPGESLLIQRLLEPLDAKQHMPPPAQPQPSAAEIALLKWWIETGASTKQRIGDLEVPAEVLPLFDQSAPQNPVFQKKISPAGASALASARQSGMRIDALGAESPWLVVSGTANRNLQKSHLEMLRKVGAQIVDLDLSGSSFDDEMAPVLADFPHLIRLNLSRTRVSALTLQKMGSRAYLEYLNISNTAVDDTALKDLVRLPMLKKLYTWQSELSPFALAQLARQQPALQILAAAPLDTNTVLQLNPPNIHYTRSFFEDTLQVELDFPFEAIGVYYTLNQASPTTQSLRYEQPIIIDKTTTVKAISAKEGWASSPVVEATFVKKYPISTDVILVRPPNEKYKALGAQSLTDGKIASEQGADTWLGYQGEDLTAIFTLQKPTELHSVYVHCLENNAPWIFKPRGVQVWVSDDGRQYQPCAAANFPANKAMGLLEVHLLNVPFDRPRTTRYVKVRVESPGKLPTWHPSAGQPCWIFIDEIGMQ
ncbi:MAG: chitobiase/beta-hexosaminidase C-terminal domain-containing protein [Lewinellaceae bacterium]|nr:chitobiase/beta-hexosaminidase C-terminal domain-containing protein [Lewinellaceae bacterium]